MTAPYWQDAAGAALARQYLGLPARDTEGDSR